MRSDLAFAFGEANRGRETMVFDWKKAAEIIRERKPKVVSAGLRDDWEWTGGIIYEDGKPVKDSYTYLESTWAVPEMEIDGEIVECYIMGNETKWDAYTKWPKKALDILNGKAGDDK